MAKPRKSKRQLLRDNRRKKKRDLEIIDGDVDDNYGQVNGNGYNDSRPAKRTKKTHKSASGANNTPLNTRRDGVLFFDDVEGVHENKPAGAVAVAGGDDANSSSGKGKRKRDTDEEDVDNVEDYQDTGDETINFNFGVENASGETEFFGLLTDSEHEYFRRADELLELNDFAGGDEERRVFLANVFREARGKELKVASSQSCSRLMERLIQVSSLRQKKRLFAAFRGHILTLVSHRFSSHCCEQLFLQSAPWVGCDVSEDASMTDAGGSDDDVEEGDDELPSLEESFLFVLDELEASLGSLLVHCFASHTLRVLLVILAGRPLDGLATQSLLRSRRKENVRVGAYAQTVATAGPHATEDPDAFPSAAQADRIVPESFKFAVHKILADVSQVIEGPLLHVLPTHPTGNPSLQLLLELEMAGKKETKGKKQKKDSDAAVEEEQALTPFITLLERLLPGAPGSLTEPGSQASTLVRTLVYDPIGSRLLETLLIHCPGKLFKAIYNGIFAYSEAKEGSEPNRPMAVYLRNDIACYPSMRVIERLGRDDLTSVVQHQVLQLQADGMAALPPASNGGRTMPPMTVIGHLVDRSRYNVLRTLFERCQARGVDSHLVQNLVNALQTTIGGGRLNPGQLVTKLCLPDEAMKGSDKKQGKQSKQGKHGQRSATEALAFHACQLLSAMVTIPGGPASAVQAALLDVTGEQLTALATQSAAGARVIVAALQSTPSLRGSAAKIPLNKQLVARLVPHSLTLATSPVGHVVLVAIVQTPSRTEVKGPAAKDARDGNKEISNTSELSLPFHLKDVLIAQLATHEDELRQSWPGRNVWRAWKGDLWRTRRSEWVHFAKAGEPEGLKLATAPVLKEKPTREQKRENHKEKKEKKEKPEKMEEGKETKAKEAKEAKKAKKAVKRAKEEPTDREQQEEKQEEKQTEAVSQARRAASVSPEERPSSDGKKNEASNEGATDIKETETSAKKKKVPQFMVREKRARKKAEKAERRAEKEKRAAEIKARRKKELAATGGDKYTRGKKLRDEKRQQREALANNEH